MAELDTATATGNAARIAAADRAVDDAMDAARATARAARAAAVPDFAAGARSPAVFNDSPEAAFNAFMRGGRA
jgi:hypothetical protein